MKRQALHSTSLTFYHPILEKEMSFTTPIPSDMQAVLRHNLKREQNSYVMKNFVPFFLAE